jgi:hypothetical protein
MVRPAQASSWSHAIGIGRSTVPERGRRQSPVIESMSPDVATFPSRGGLGDEPPGSRRRPDDHDRRLAGEEDDEDPQRQESAEDEADADDDEDRAVTDRVEDRTEARPLVEDAREVPVEPVARTDQDHQDERPRRDDRREVE